MIDVMLRFFALNENSQACPLWFICAGQRDDDFHLHPRGHCRSHESNDCGQAMREKLAHEKPAQGEVLKCHEYWQRRESRVFDERLGWNDEWQVSPDAKPEQSDARPVQQAGFVVSAGWARDETQVCYAKPV